MVSRRYLGSRIRIFPDTNWTRSRGPFHDFTTDTKTWSHIEDDTHCTFSIGAVITVHVYVDLQKGTLGEPLHVKQATMVDEYGVIREFCIPN